MPSQNVINLQNRLALVQAQIAVLQAQPVLVPTSLDGQSFDPLTALVKYREMEKELMHEIFRALPFEIPTRTLLT